VLSDIGSGLNFERKNFKRLLRQIMHGEVERVVVAYQDRLCRVAFDLISFICRENNTELLVHKRNKEGSPESELVEDLLAIVHVFSSRLYGKRGAKHRQHLSTLGPEQKSIGASDLSIDTGSQGGALGDESPGDRKALSYQSIGGEKDWESDFEQEG
jgi:hypothetical protein